jgi:WD40 repeat protein
MSKGDPTLERYGRAVASLHAFARPSWNKVSVMLITVCSTFRGHTDTITSVCFSPTMRQLVSGSLDNCVMVWNFRPQLRAYRFLGHTVSLQ